MLNALDAVFVPSEAVISNAYVVYEFTAGVVPVIAPVDELIDAHAGRFVEE